MSEQWSLGVNDPTLIAWIIVGCYLIGSMGSWRSQKQWHNLGKNNEFPAWGLLSGILVLLGINKQLDLHTPILMVIRQIQSESAWLLAIGTVAIIVGLAITVMISFLHIRFGFTYNIRLLSAYGALGALLMVQIIRFSASRHGSWFTLHPFGDEGIWHIHLIELIELLLIGLVGILAWSESRRLKGFAHSE